MSGGRPSIISLQPEARRQVLALLPKRDFNFYLTRSISELAARCLCNEAARTRKFMSGRGVEVAPRRRATRCTVQTLAGPVGLAATVLANERRREEELLEAARRGRAAARLKAAS